MAAFTLIDATRVNTDNEGFYATNNQFQLSGPKGFIEVKVLENNDIYVRVDLPGVPDDAIRYRVDGVRQKVVFFSGETPNEGGVREYSGTTGLGCDCCNITEVDAKMKDGVLRMILSRVKVKDHETKCTLTLPPPFTGRSGQRVEDHPFVVRGRKGANYAEARADGSIFLVLDMPGVGEGGEQVIHKEFEVKFRGQTKNVSEHDESGRFYMGKVGNAPEIAPSFLRHTVSSSIEAGVLKILIAPPPRRSRSNTNA
ncbi:unnamed protein product [Microthlaspi erraticum]|uniref:SHSP domain-containing protein n=1 Tax=Microthlaspi erraticum TaxID=1685480 RepID=A0A6D2JRN5_9BRAS|nr:unnamed protein product [Microthlaspi erraticum]